jgi:2-phosphosulfolactate phosphatase
MIFSRLTLSDPLPPDGGVYVVIDVIRAFTTTAFALGAGVESILLTGEVEEALALRARFPGALAMGEVGGRRPPGFDLGNSPAALAEVELRGRTLVQRTSAGTQGVVKVFNGRPSAPVYAASFPTAGATARAVARLQPARVSFVITGIFEGGFGDEDAACADYLQALLESPGEAPAAGPYLERVRSSASALKFRDAADPDFRPGDIACCTALDRFDFALRVRSANGLLVMNAER